MRRLAAIMFTDIVDFSRQMGSDEARRLSLLDLQRIMYPRMRPKKTAAPAVSLSPAERLQFLKAGGSQAEKKGERLRGSPHSGAQQSAHFLTEKGLV